jgi:cardiolipin synthase A/B
MLYLTIVGATFIAWLIVVTLFTPAVPYHLETSIDPDEEHFVHVLESACQARLLPGNRIDILTNGAQFYPAMLDAIAAARESISMECYIFKRGEIGDRFIHALSERARAGVRVTITLDYIGSFSAWSHAEAALAAAGCRVERYQALHWYRLGRLNNRTHRELLIVDGRVAFVGGAGVADWWWKPLHGRAAWRDMMARIEGPVVPDIQGVVAENWLECCGEILTGRDVYKPQAPVGDSPAFPVRSSPSDRSTTSRVLFQTLVESAMDRVVIVTPYFLPDRMLRRGLLRTARRGVPITVIVPGAQTDQKWVRLASRRLYGSLLRAGVRIFEYEPGMTHAKALIVDNLWTVIGTTNFDNRSFEHNDEVNLVVRDVHVAERLMVDFEADLSRCREIVAEGWQARPLWEKLVGTVAWILERQQ